MWFDGTCQDSILFNVIKANIALGKLDAMMMRSIAALKIIMLMMIKDLPKGITPLVIAEINFQGTKTATRLLEF
jgi:hypothetical protein